MGEAHMMSMAGALARKGTSRLHNAGVFATRRPYDQIINSIAYPNLSGIAGFMPGVSARAVRATRRSKTSPSCGRSRT